MSVDNNAWMNRGLFIALGAFVGALAGTARYAFDSEQSFANNVAQGAAIGVVHYFVLAAMTELIAKVIENNEALEPDVNQAINGLRP